MEKYQINVFFKEMVKIPEVSALLMIVDDNEKNAGKKYKQKIEVNRVKAKKENRKAKVMKAQQKISYQQNKKHIGEIMEGLIIGKDNENTYLFRSYFNAPDDVDGKIFVASNNELKLGQKAKVKITDAFVYDLMGEIIN